MTTAVKGSLRGPQFQTPFFFCTIVLSSWLGGMGCGLFATLLSALLIEFFSLQTTSEAFPLSHLPRMAVFLLAGGFISWLGGRQRRDEEALLRSREELEVKVLARTFDLQHANEELKTENIERLRQKARAEARTESVMRANRTIPASLAHLGDTNDLRQLLGEVLTVIVEYLDESGGSVWLYNKERDRLHMHVVVENGSIKPPSETTHPAAAVSDQEAQAMARIGRSELLAAYHKQGAAIFLADDIATVPYFAPYRQHLLQTGVRSIFAVPLLAGSDLLGLISVRSGREHPLAGEEIAFVQAIANHASLALKMSQLAEIERRSVVEEERRDAILRHREAIGRIALAGSATLQRLAESPELNTFLDHVLAVSIDQFDATCAGVWLGDPATGICNQFIFYNRGDRNHTVEPGYSHHLEPIEENGRASALLRRGIVIHREADFETIPAYREHREVLRQRNIRTILYIPLFFGAESRGIFMLKFASDRTLSPEEDGLAHSLSNQVVLALELTKLSEKAKAAALADERNRLAADVHDILAQAFAATLLHLRSMNMSATSAESQSHWKFAQGTASEGLTAARRAINAFRTVAPADRRPLPERLAERVRQVAARMLPHTKVNFAVQGQSVPLPWAVEDELERMANEALFNAERHSGARTISVTLNYLAEKGLRLCVQDDGRGFDEDKPGGAGFGLRSMQDRAERLGASFTLITESGRGTEIIVVWTSDPNPADAATHD